MRGLLRSKSASFWWGSEGCAEGYPVFCVHSVLGGGGPEGKAYSVLSSVVPAQSPVGVNQGLLLSPCFVLFFVWCLLHRGSGTREPVPETPPPPPTRRHGRVTSWWSLRPLESCCCCCCVPRNSDADCHDRAHTAVDRREFTPRRSRQGLVEVLLSVTKHQNGIVLARGRASQPPVQSGMCNRHDYNSRA